LQTTGNIKLIHTDIDIENKQNARLYMYELKGDDLTLYSFMKSRIRKDKTVALKKMNSVSVQTKKY
jgi:hypothetical protein